MALERKPMIAVIGAGKCSGKLRRMAAEVGKYVVENGGVIVCGGMGGIMEGAARGAAEAGGMAVGILPGTDKNDANEFIEIAIPTGFGEARNIMVINSADAVVAFPGKFGTLSEMAFALKAKKPVISISAWKLGDDIIQMSDPVEAAKKAMELATGAMPEKVEEPEAPEPTKAPAKKRARKTAAKTVRKTVKKTAKKTTRKTKVK